jgi:hypothetical protein
MCTVAVYVSMQRGVENRRRNCGGEDRFSWGAVNAVETGEAVDVHGAGAADAIERDVAFLIFMTASRICGW